MAQAALRESWAIAVHAALVGFRDVLIGQLVPDGAGYRLVLTMRESPPAGELVLALQDALGPLAAREDSALARDEPGWHFYPAVGERDRELFSRLDWSHAVVLHEWVD